MTATVGLVRNKGIDIWTHFKYNGAARKSWCVVLSGEKSCSYKISGKKTTETTNVKRPEVTPH